MGNCTGKLTDEQKMNDVIDRQMLEARENYASKIKILLLGAGESGKSTLFKQMKLLYSQTKKFTNAEKATFRNIIYGNIVADAKILIRATETHSKIVGSSNKKIAHDVLDWPKNLTITPVEANMLETLWKDKGIVDSWNDRGNIQVQDAFEYYMNNISRIGSPEWEPTNQDILRSRARTSGVVQENFEIDQTKFEMYDVGGQRNERRKWIHQFEGVTTVLFVAAISEYNQVLYEDSSVNRQDEAVQLFRDQLKIACFVHTPFILFLNKIDLFREKLPKIPFRVASGHEQRNVDFEGPHCDPDKEYKTGENDGHAEFEKCYQAAINYLTWLYESQSPEERGEEKQIYTHPTNSTDSDNIQRIMTSCKDIILKENLAIGGWL